MSEDREQKNAIFAGPPAVDPRFPRASAAEMMKADFGLEIPSEVVPLPSCGKTYPLNSPLHGLETVEIKSMTTKEEDILTSKAFIKKGTVITELIRSCIIDKRVNPLELLSGDRNALMVAIRITGYGAEYSVERECSECDAKAPHEFDLSALPIKRLDIDPTTPGTNVFEFKLPQCKKVVHFKFMTGADEQEIASTAEKQKKIGISTENNISTSLLYSIISIDGNEDRAKIANFIKAMPARDSLALRNYIKDHEPGIIMKQETTCPACGHEEEVNMPLGYSFLWPGSDR